MSAELENGVLEVRIPKPEETKPRRVQIQGAANGNGKPAIEGTAEEN